MKLLFATCLFLCCFSVTYAKEINYKLVNKETKEVSMFADVSISAGNLQNTMQHLRTYYDMYEYVGVDKNGTPIYEFDFVKYTVKGKKTTYWLVIYNDKEKGYYLFRGKTLKRVGQTLNQYELSTSTTI